MCLIVQAFLTQLWHALSFSYSGGGQIETRGGKPGPGRPKKQREHVDKSTGNEDKDCKGDKEREGKIVAFQYDCGKTFDSKKKTGEANNEQGCGKRAAEDDSGDAHLSGYKKKQSLVACSSFVYA